MKQWLSCAAILLSIAANPSHAHHSGAAVDMEHTVTIQGTVKQFQWTNPHVWIFVLVEDSAGNVVEWAIEGPAVMGVVQKGMRKEDLKVGDKVEITINPRRDGKPSGGLQSLRLTETGKSYGFGSQFPSPPK